MLVAQTVPGAQCTITIYYTAGPSSAGGVADSLGQVAWTWLVVTTIAPGSYSIVVTATSGGITGSQTTSFTVQ